LAVGGYFLQANTGTMHWSTARAVATVAVLELFGVGLPLRWLVGRFGVSGFGTKIARVLAAIVAATAASALVGALVFPDRRPRGAAAVAGVGPPLAAVTAVLMVAYPPATQPSPPAPATSGT